MIHDLSERKKCNYKTRGWMSDVKCVLAQIAIDATISSFLSIHTSSDEYKIALFTINWNDFFFRPFKSALVAVIFWAAGYIITWVIRLEHFEKVWKENERQAYAAHKS